MISNSNTFLLVPRSGFIIKGAFCADLYRAIATAQPPLGEPIFDWGRGRLKRKGEGVGNRAAYCTKWHFVTERQRRGVNNVFVKNIAQNRPILWREGHAIVRNRRTALFSDVL